MSIENVKRQTECHFASRARIVQGPAWSTDQEFNENIERQARALEAFVATIRDRSDDGFCITLPDAFGTTVPRLAATVNRVLRRLSALDPSKAGCFARPVETHEWRFSYCGEVFFVLSLGSCYPRTHARFTFNAKQTFLLLQSDCAFARYCPAGAGLIPTEIRDKIRVAYAQANRIYDLTHTVSPFEGHRFVKPLELREEPIRWWKADVSKTYCFER